MGPVMLALGGVVLLVLLLLAVTRRHICCENSLRAPGTSRIRVSLGPDPAD